MRTPVKFKRIVDGEPGQLDMVVEDADGVEYLLKNVKINKVDTGKVIAPEYVTEIPIEMVEIK